MKNACSEAIRELSNDNEPEIESVLGREIEEHLACCRHRSALTMAPAILLAWSASAEVAATQA